MANFNNCKEEIRACVARRLGKQYTVDWLDCLKNNGVVEKRMQIRKTGDATAALINLDTIVEPNEGRLEIADDLAEEILQIYKLSLENKEQVKRTADDMNSYKTVRDRIILKLINTERNRELLKTVPSVPICDLSIVFCLYLSDRLGKAAALIRNEHLELWGVTIEELYRDAKRNTPIILPVKFRAIEEIMAEATGVDVWGTPNIPEDLRLYYLGNTEDLFGATAILYPGVLKQVAEKWKKDLYILPSSIQETMILPCNENLNKDELSEMVRTINQCEVSPEEQLSDHVYRYDYQNDKILVA